MEGTIASRFISKITASLSRFLDDGDVKKLDIQVEVHQYEIAKCIHFVLQTCNGIQCTHDPADATTLAHTYHQCNVHASNSMIINDMNVQGNSESVRLLHYTDVQQAVTIASGKEYYIWESVTDSNDNTTISADESYKYKIKTNNDQGQQADNPSSTLPCDKNEKEYCKMSLTVRQHGAMEAWFPSMITHQDHPHPSHIRARPCHINNIYQCVGCGYLGNDRYDLLAHCATAIVGPYNGYLMHMEDPFVDGRVAIAKINTHKGKVSIPYDPDNVLEPGDISDSVCKGERIQRADASTPSNSTTGESEAICQIFEETLGDIHIHQNHQINLEANEEPLRGSDMAGVQTHTRQEFLFNTDSQAAIHMFKRPPNTIRRIVRSPHKFVMSRFLHLRRQATQNNINITFHHQRACHDLTDVQERQKPMADLNNRCDIKAKQQADGGRTNAGRYLSRGDGITGLRYYIKQRGTTVQGDYYTVLSDIHRLQCFHRATRHNNNMQKMNDMLWSSDKINAPVQSLICKKFPNHVRTRLYQFLLDILPMT
jgi:hypothetical protein